MSEKNPEPRVSAVGRVLSYLLAEMQHGVSLDIPSNFIKAVKALVDFYETIRHDEDLAGVTIMLDVMWTICAV